MRLSDFPTSEPNFERFKKAILRQVEPELIRARLRLDYDNVPENFLAMLDEGRRIAL